MIVLDKSTRLLQVVLAGAVTANQLPVVANYKTFPDQRPVSANTQTNSGTAVTVVTGLDSPQAVAVEELSVFNADTGAVTLTVQLKDGSTTRKLWAGSLQVGDTLAYSSTGFKVTDLNGNQKTTGGKAVGGLLRAPQVLTNGTTYNPPTGCNAIRVTAYGAGGGGGGCDSNTSNGGAGGGGAAGAKVIKYYLNPPQGCTYAIGAAGTAGANTGGTGGTGGDTTFTDGTTLITAKGGLGGVGMTNGTSNIKAAGGAGVVGTNGDINGKGDAGEHGERISGTVGASGRGGATDIGAGGVGLNAAAAGTAGTNGGGGGGALVLNNSGAVAGGAGGAGLIVIEEFS